MHCVILCSSEVFSKRSTGGFKYALSYQSISSHSKVKRKKTFLNSAVVVVPTETDIVSLLAVDVESALTIQPQRVEKEIKGKKETQNKKYIILNIACCFRKPKKLNFKLLKLNF